MQIRASAQAPDGMIVRDWELFYTHESTKMFPEAELTKAAHDVGEQVTKIAAAPHGRKLFGPRSVRRRGLGADDGGDAGPQSAHRAQSRSRRAGGAAQAAATELEGRRGVRIMPEFFDVTDDPTRPLFGHEEVDDEGVPEKPVSLVEKGVLKDFLRTREPVRGYSESNGRARLIRRARRCRRT